MTTPLNAKATADISAAMLAAGVLPEEVWDQADDACDCVFVRIGFWTNPYSGQTLEVRMCCIWEQLYELFPQFVRRTPAFRDYNRDEWETQPMTWNGEGPMPRGLWYRQRARIEGITVPEARAKYAGQEPPQGWTRPAAKPRKRWWQRWI